MLHRYALRERNSTLHGLQRMLLAHLAQLGIFRGRLLQAPLPCKSWLCVTGTFIAPEGVVSVGLSKLTLT